MKIWLGHEISVNVHGHSRSVEHVGTRVMNEVVAFNLPKATISIQSLGLEASPFNRERALSATQLPIVTTAAWLFNRING